MPQPPAIPDTALDQTAAIAPFAEGSRILHIGPPKTGTTALQTACWSALGSLREQGLHYAGGQAHAAKPARAVTGRPHLTGNKRSVPSIKWWNALLQEMERAHGSRLLYSSEALAEATDDRILRIAGDVGPSLQILVTLRPIDAVLASSWQQAVQNGGEHSLDQWLQQVLGEEQRGGQRGLHRVLRQGELVDRWAAGVGTDKVTVVILDPANRGFLFRTCDALLSLQPGTLRQVDERANRSLTLPEVEVIRRMNAQARAIGLGNGARSDLIYSGAAANAKRRPAPAGAPTVRLPSWALQRAAELGAETYTRLTASGVRVIGDPATLVPQAPPAGADASLADRELLVDPETAATIAMGVAWGFGLRLGPDQPEDSRTIPLGFVPTRELARLVLLRGLGRVKRRLKLARARDG